MFVVVMMVVVLLEGGVAVRHLDEDQFVVSERVSGVMAVIMRVDGGVVAGVLFLC